MSQRRLYLEQRIAIVSARLNEETLRFTDNLPLEMQAKFNFFVRGCLNILDVGLPEHVTRAEKVRFGLSSRRD